MKKLNILIIFFVLANPVQAQKYMTQNGVISFFSSTPVEDIEAINNQVSAVLDTDSGEMAAVLLMKAFNFEKALMQEHFNEKFVESEKYPKSVFKGQITDFDSLELNDSKNDVTITGELTIHGVTQKIDTTGSITKSDSLIGLEVDFNVNPEDFDINIPGPVKEKIAKRIKVSVNLNMNKM
ncbi:MAG: YceI family protein [Flavobacteriaceae bacterium]|nr:YceI family protein [Flavobacteriaceae bacterium]